MIERNFVQAALGLAPLTIPICALSGAISGALSGGSTSLLSESGFIAFSIAFALVGGVPIGLLFWAMKDTSGSMRATFALILLLVGCLAFLALFTPLYGVNKL